jgi:hypothetical protein
MTMNTDTAKHDMREADTILREAVYEAIDSAEKALRSGELCGWELELIRRRVAAWVDAQKAPQPRTAEPALSMKRHEWDSLSPEARKLIHDRTREHTLKSARAAQDVRDAPLAAPVEPAPAHSDEGCICQRCRSIFRVDFIVADELWERIKPAGAPSGGGLLCGTCIAAEIERLTLGFAAYRIAEAQAAPPAAPPLPEPAWMTQLCGRDPH